MVFENVPWFYFSISSMILFGVMSVLYKLPETKNISKLAAVFWMMVTSLVLSLLLFYPHFLFTTSALLWFAFLWGAQYVILTLMQMYALKHVETPILFSISSILSLLISVIIGIIIFKDTLSILQIIGLILIIITVFLFVYKKGKIQYATNIIWLLIGIVLVSAFGKVIQKLGVQEGDIYNLQIYQYFFGIIIALIAMYVVDKKDYTVKTFTKSAKTGIIIGSIAFFGGYAILTALITGPFSLITAIHSLYILVAAIFAWMFFKEKLTLRKVALIMLAIIAITLVRLG